MKKIILAILAFCVVAVMAQPPQKMSYQAVVRNAANELVANQQVSAKISILRHSSSGAVVFAETHSGMTNANGLLTLIIGDGNALFAATLADIPWGDDDFFLKAEIDPTGGSNYQLSNVHQLLTVPYAFHSGTTSYVDYNQLDNRPAGTRTGDLMYWDATDQTWHIVAAGAQGDVLVMGPNGVPQWSNNVGGSGGSGSAPLNVLPIVVTDSVFNITGRTAMVAATIVSSGSSGVTASGICWSTNANPSIGNSFTTDGTSFGDFVSIAQNLTSGTTFYARAYATNSVGTSYGNAIKFITPTHCGALVDYDGNSYQTVYIGAQCWMKENLRTTHFANGGSIAQGTVGTTTAYQNNSYYYYCNDDPTTAAQYGLLYTWAAAMNGAGVSSNNPSGIQGICPSGWHLPSSAEWCELENYIEPGIDVNCGTDGTRGSMAKKLVLPTDWNAYPTNSFAPGYWRTDPSGFNETGFSALPNGYISEKNYYGQNTTAYWWTCSKESSYLIYRSITYSGVGVTRSELYQSNTTSYASAFGIRCVKN